MERELWRWVATSLRLLPRRSPRGAVYDNRSVLAVLLWAAMHERSIHWACQRANWPMQAWRRRLPDQSTMSRRLRDPRIFDDLVRLLSIVQRRMAVAGDTLIVDGKPLAVSEFTADPDARSGWGAGRHSIGYKLHALVDEKQRLVAFDVQPMNKAECVCARDLLAAACRSRLIAGGSTLLGDASYDSNRLHEAAAQAGVRLIAPRRCPDKKLCKNRVHHPGRLEAVRFTEHDPHWETLRTKVRTTVERFFGTLASFGGGLWSLPTWVRRLHRVRPWVAAKLNINAARQHLKTAAGA